MILLFTSRGINLYSVAKNFFSEGDWLNTFIFNRRGGSLDPGIFTFVLRIWGNASLSVFWLRLLPLTFFAIGTILILFIRKDDSPKYSTFFILPFLFSNQVVMNLAVTIRPYMMEFCGSALLIFLLRNIEKETTTILKIALALLLIFFCGSRYIIWFLYVGLVLFFFFHHRKHINLKVHWPWFLPCLYMVITLFTTTSYQLSDLNFSYADPFYLTSSFQNVKNLLTNPYFYFLLSYPLYLFFMVEKKDRSPFDHQFSMYALYVLIIYFALDFFHKSPFHLDERFTISFHLFGLISLSLLLQTLFNELVGKKHKTLVFLCSLAAAFQLVHFEFKQQSDLVPIVRQMEKTLNQEDTVYADFVAYSMIMYLKNFTQFKIDWEKMPKFESIDFSDITETKFGKHSYFLVIEGFNGTKTFRDKIMESGRYQKVAGSYFQNLYEFKE